MRENKLVAYQPYPKQAEFHAAGKTHRERLLLAGNQVGKTLAGSMEVAMHLTGLYPTWWLGRRWDRPVRVWAAGVTGETTRDTVQRHLLGALSHFGTGSIPARALKQCIPARGIAGFMDMVLVRHVSGGTSYLALKSYEKGREKWQGETLDLVWFDEEPPLEIYTEGLTRTNATEGISMITFTPLLGPTTVALMFLEGLNYGMANGSGLPSL